MADDSFLKQAYQLKNTADTIALYQEWAESYDRSVREHGYVTPGRCVAALQRHQLDGCKTGTKNIAGRAEKPDRFAPAIKRGTCPGGARSTGGWPPLARGCVAKTEYGAGHRTASPAAFAHY